MLNIFLAWGFQFALLSGLGWLIYARLFRLQGTVWNAQDLFRSFWIGFGALLTVAQIYAFFFPLKGVFLGMAGALALPGLWFLAQAARARAPAAGAPAGWGRLIFWTLLACCVLRAAAGVSTTAWSGFYDSDLYHFGAVRWAKEYPAVPGLANLFGPRNALLGRNRPG